MSKPADECSDRDMVKSLGWKVYENLVSNPIEERWMVFLVAGDQRVLARAQRQKNIGRWLPGWWKIWIHSIEENQRWMPTMLKRLNTIAAVLLALATLYVGSYLLLLNPLKAPLANSQDGYIRLPLFKGGTTISEETWLHTFYYPLLELDQRIRPEYWYRK